MMREFVAAISLTLAAVCAFARSPQTAPAAPAAATPSAGTDLTIHYKGSGVTVPELVSVSGKFDPVDHCKKLDGKVKLLIAVDRNGSARLVFYLDSKDPDLFPMAQRVLDFDHFKPGTADGTTAIVGVADTMKLQACRMEKTNEQGNKQNILQLRSMPEQTFELVDAPEGAMTSLATPPGTPGAHPAAAGLSRIGHEVTAPVLTHSVDPEFSDAARKAKFQGICMVSLIVDVNGVPQHPQVVRPLGMGLDQKAIQAVKQFRFKPALKDGKTPVPVMITVEVNFRLY